ncbi:tRNA (adenosine(37)-N6)-threonylcarbamoyltransferase complex dimerization subunit type 1 TsaB [Enteractinococcus fodinae]|uniref:tRNA threonylcarbamoyl adenosine modification protein YeaZ n=1 Tax=Enteractinococcus fodinae TaxID=684663 RepID=A0ABU2AZS0_9MICC|nr:tRNA (adenosine(37)-N6)-threonylcarbamoyltransferase complex dimerization subunit type 1 TsaB [Enteractinococcus fodinae]MDR7346516.1 tRNA threonylcarbamoyl adenosine modification protein YeaZ [Enteractinococcus fodinae]
MSTTYLAMDTSATASAAVYRDGQTIAHRATDSHRNHSEVLAGFITEVLAEAGLDPHNPQALDGIFVGVGPGPFTGLRAGIITAQTLAHTWQVPVYGVLSHDGLAHRVAPAAFRIGAEEFIVATDARRKEVYWAHYDNIGGQPQRLHGPFVTDPQDVTKLPVYGAGAGLYPEVLHGMTGYTDAVPDAADIAAFGSLALRRGSELLPVEPQYLRGHDAQIPKNLRP